MLKLTDETADLGESY